MLKFWNKVAKSQPPQQEGSWFVYQIFDEMIQRWSPPFFAHTKVVMRLEVQEMVKKMDNRPITVRTIGTLRDFQLTPEVEIIEFGDRSKLNA